MEFKTEAQESVYRRVVEYATQLFGEQLIVEGDRPIVGLWAGSAIVRAAVLPWGEDDAVVNVWSWIVRDVEPTADLMHYLLRENRDMRFGAFSLDADNDIVFEHTIAGSSLDKDELRASIYAVISTADKADDEIVSRWGGRRATDRVEE